jgi:hypothetical protein
MSSAQFRARSLSLDVNACSRATTKMTKPYKVGLILLNSSLKLVYCNAEAQRIFTYPNGLETMKDPSPELAGLVRLIVGNRRESNDTFNSLFFVSGRRRYVCRSFALKTDSDWASKPSLGITMERPNAAIAIAPPIIASPIRRTGI